LTQRQYCLIVFPYFQGEKKMRMSFTKLLLASSILFAAQAQATTYNMGSLSEGSGPGNSIHAGVANQGAFSEQIDFNISSYAVQPQSYVAFTIGSGNDITDQQIAIYQVLGLGKTKLVAAGSDFASFQSTPNTNYDVILTGIGADSRNNFSASARISPVPEPESGALLAAGIALVGLAFAAKKYRAAPSMKQAGG
jgi:hypothetical protein